MQPLDTSDGGKGANQAVAAASQGAIVALVARVGDDLAGEALLRGLEAAGVETSWVRRSPGERSGAAFVTVTPDGENTIIVAPVRTRCSARTTSAGPRVHFAGAGDRLCSWRPASMRWSRPSRRRVDRRRSCSMPLPPVRYRARPSGGSMSSSSTSTRRRRSLVVATGIPHRVGCTPRVRTRCSDHHPRRRRAQPSPRTRGALARVRAPRRRSSTPLEQATRSSVCSQPHWRRAPTGSPTEATLRDAVEMAVAAASRSVGQLGARVLLTDRPLDQVWGGELGEE